MISNLFLQSLFRRLFFLLLAFWANIGFAQFELPEGYKLRDFYKGKYVCDSCPIYQLPFDAEKKVWVAQGYNGCFSHKGELSLDFKLKKGTPIYAARSGVVSRIKEDSKERGLKRKYLSKGNHIIIKHRDGTYAGYWHLQFEGVLPEVGDSIHVGDLIAYSGNTGYSSLPHLHFFVYYYRFGIRYTIPTPFYTSKGIRYLRGWRSYKRREKRNSPDQDR